MTSLSCECRSCQSWYAGDNIIITCAHTKCIWGLEVNLMCGDVDGSGTTTPRYVFARTGLKNCGYYNVVGNEYFKEYKTIVRHAEKYLKDLERYTCACGKPTKVVVEKVTAVAFKCYSTTILKIKLFFIQISICHTLFF